MRLKQCQDQVSECEHQRRRPKERKDMDVPPVTLAARSTLRKYRHLAVQMQSRTALLSLRSCRLLSGEARNSLPRDGSHRLSLPATPQARFRMPSYEYDLVVIGSGPAGQKA